MRPFHDLPIRRKLSLVILLVSAVASLVASIVFGVYDWLTFRQAMRRDLLTLADVLANNSTAALAFHYPDTAGELLAGLRSHPRVVAAALYSDEPESQSLFAIYSRAGSGRAIPPRPPAAGAHFQNGSLVVCQPIVLGEKRIGAIYLQSDLVALRARLRLYAGIVALVLLATLLVTAAISVRVQRSISQPILSLAQTARDVSVHRCFTMRAAKASEDEIGQLTDGFNQMLAALQERDEALRRGTEMLEGEVAVRRHAEEELRTLNETLEQRVSERTAAAEQASRAKSEFLANMSHELRTPLNSVIGFANLLLKNKHHRLLPEEAGYLERILVNGKNLLDLINDVLDLAKVESRHLELHLEPVDLAALVRAVLAEVEPQARERRLRLAADLPERLSALVTDGARLHQILLNLVGNAVKFTSHGEVRVRVEADAESGAPLAAHVQDTGIGIPRDKQFVIFEAFRQADSSTARKYGGTGLGLAICQSLCRLMGYRIGVASEEGKGSTFSVHFQAAPSNHEASEAT